MDQTISWEYPSSNELQGVLALDEQVTVGPVLVEFSELARLNKQLKDYRKCIRRLQAEVQGKRPYQTKQVNELTGEITRLRADLKTSEASLSSTRRQVATLNTELSNKGLEIQRLKVQLYDLQNRENA